MQQRIWRAAARRRCGRKIKPAVDWVCACWTSGPAGPVCRCGARGHGQRSRLLPRRVRGHTGRQRIRLRLQHLCQVVVAGGFDIAFVAPARLGDELVADAVERTRFGRSGLFDVTVTCQRDSASTPGTDSIVFCSRCGRRNPRPRRSPPAGWRGNCPDSGPAAQGPRVADRPG